jgi:site-specific DNA-adenine methylase
MLPNNAVEIVNDADGCLVNAWRSIQHAPDLVASHLETLGGGHEVTLAAISRELGEARQGLVERLKSGLEWCDARLAAAWLHGMAAAINLAGTTALHLLRPRGVLKFSARGAVLQWLRSLARRLEHVTIMCGDWVRCVCSSAIHETVCPAAILLDPPYRHAGSSTDMYACESDVSQDVAEWAAEHGKREDLRIVLCGLAGEHSMPSGWRYVDGQVLQAASRGKTRRIDRLYLSPHCLPVEGEQPCVEGEAIRRRQKSIFDLMEAG